MKEIKLRDYQKQCKSELYVAFKEGWKRILVCVPTGGGKSTIFSSFVKDCLRWEKKVLFMVHSKELVNQFSDRLKDQFGIYSSTIMAGVKPDYTSPAQVASVQSLVRREIPFTPDVIIVDECHRSKAKTYTKIIERFPDARIVGLTATPFRGDGKGLSDVYDKIIHPIKIKQLIELGHLVGTKVYAPQESVDMTGVDTVRGDYDKKEMANRFGDSGITMGVVENYQKYCSGKKAIVFNVNVELSKEMCEKFKDAGIKAAHLDGATKDKERERVVKAFSKGEYDVLCNVMLFTEGFDVPDTEVVILNRATKSLGVFVQMVGRGLRPANNKSHCIVLDHGGNTLEHGFVEDYDSVVFSLKDKPKKKGKKKVTKKCPKCFVVNRIFDKVCSSCGEKFKSKERELKFSDGSKFVLLDRSAFIVDRLMKLPYKKLEGKIPVSQLRLVQALKGYKNGWHFHQAIEHYFPDIIKEDSKAWGEVNFRLDLAEVEDGTDIILKQVKKLIKKHGNIHREEQKFLRAKSF